MAKTKRNLFNELMEGVGAMKEHREGKLTLRSYNVESTPLPQVDAKMIKETRENLHCSRAVFARKLRANERTLEKWEQGRLSPIPKRLRWYCSFGNILTPLKGLTPFLSKDKPYPAGCLRSRKVRGVTMRRQRRGRNSSASLAA